MKMKSFAILTISGFLAITFGSTAVMADDANSNGQSVQAPMTPSDNSMQNQNGTDQPNTDTSQGDSSNNSSSSSGSSDEGSSPDTATGDDDY
jgi:hypothetical protein